MGVLAAALLVPAIANGFPLIFPDSGTYLGIATGHDYAIDRSSVYGLLLKPIVTTWPATGGLWLAVVAQALGVAAILWGAAGALRGRRDATLLASLLGLIALTALPWHAGQFMPDALTGPLILVACLAATRAPGSSGTPLLWLAATILALTHYTHVVLLGTVAAAAIAAQLALGLPWRQALRRFGAAALACATAVALLATANQMVLGRLAMSPVGPFFLFARLNEDGLTGPWLDRHCGRDAPALLCAARAGIPRSSQTLLWGGAASPIAQAIWQPADEATRWRWIAMLAQANRGAIGERPMAFLASSLRGTARQLARFRAIDDECPAGCGRNPTGGIALILARDRAAALPALLASRQLRDTNPKAPVRAITTPVAAVSLLLLPAMLALAWRRRDAPAFAFAAGIAAALIANAAMAGALSDVHDRYQSRIVWLAPFLVLMLALRWRRTACPPRPPGA